MKISVVVEERFKDGTMLGSTVLGVFFNKEQTDACINQAYEKFVEEQSHDESLDKRVYVDTLPLKIVGDDVTILAKEKCPDEGAYFHQTDDSIYCMGFIEGFETAVAKYL
jgi:hypothetical protein